MKLFQNWTSIVALIVEGILILAFPGCKSITHTVPEFEMEKSVVVLSLDDSPNVHGDTTARVLDILKKYNISAMFSVLGVNAEQHPELVRRIHDEGHIIINHGYSDKWASNMGDREFRENLEKGEAAIASALGREALYPRLYRPHGGFYSERQEKIVREAGWTLIGANIRGWDAACSEPEKDKVVRQIIKKTEKNRGGIILLHDGKDSYRRLNAGVEKNPSGTYNRSWIPDAVEEIIIALLEKGYVFKTPVY